MLYNKALFVFNKRFYTQLHTHVLIDKAIIHFCRKRQCMLTEDAKIDT